MPLRRAKKQDLLTPIARPAREIEVPGLDVTVLVRMLSAAESSKCLAGLVDASGLTDLGEMQARQLAACLVEPSVSVQEAREILTYWTSEAVNAILSAATGSSGDDD